jgi:hypothetical protein
MSFTLESRLHEQTISAHIEAPRRKNFEAIRLYLRRPGSLPIKSVRVNGKQYRDFNADAGYITLRPGPNEFNVEAQYR